MNTEKYAQLLSELDPEICYVDYNTTCDGIEAYIVGVDVSAKIIYDTNHDAFTLSIADANYENIEFETNYVEETEQNAQYVDLTIQWFDKVRQNSEELTSVFQYLLSHKNELSYHVIDMDELSHNC